MKPEPSLFDAIDPEAEALADAEGIADIDAGRTIATRP
jgi:predicted transcriptional regulator